MRWQGREKEKVGMKTLPRRKELAVAGERKRENWHEKSSLEEGIGGDRGEKIISRE